MAAIFDSPLIHTSGSLRSSLDVLPDPYNMGIAVESSLLYVIFYPLPVNGRHLRFPKNPDVEQYSQ